MVDTFDSSTAMLKLSEKNPTVAKYPWATINVGSSFAADKSDVKRESLVVLAYKNGKKHGKRFRVLDHPGPSYEVGCVGLVGDKNIPRNRNAEAAGKIKTEKAIEVASVPQNEPAAFKTDPETAPEPLGWKITGPTVVENPTPVAGVRAVDPNRKYWADK